MSGPFLILNGISRQRLDPRMAKAMYDVYIFKAGTSELGTFFILLICIIIIDIIIS